MNNQKQQIKQQVSPYSSCNNEKEFNDLELKLKTDLRITAATIERIKFILSLNAFLYNKLKECKLFKEIIEVLKQYNLFHKKNLDLICQLVKFLKYEKFFKDNLEKFIKSSNKPIYLLNLNHNLIDEIDQAIASKSNKSLINSLNNYKQPVDCSTICEFYLAKKYESSQFSGSNFYELLLYSLSQNKHDKLYKEYKEKSYNDDHDKEIDKFYSSHIQINECLSALACKTDLEMKTVSTVLKNTESITPSNQIQLAIQSSDALPSLDNEIYEHNCEGTRGFCVILNIKLFNDEYLKERTGSDVDVKNIKETFEKFNYDVKICEYEDRDKILEYFKILSQLDELRAHDSLMLFLMSHGYKNCILDKNGKKILYDEFIELFNAHNCKSLINKPKVIIIASCQTDEENYDARRMPAIPVYSQYKEPNQADSTNLSTNSYRSAARFFDDNDSNNLISKNSVSEYNDFLIYTASMCGTSSYRNDNGTFLIQNLISNINNSKFNNNENK